jgi:hypothetical protein
VKRSLPVLLAVAALVTPAAASARVTIFSVTSPARTRHQVTLVLSVSSPATCAIIVHYKSGPSHASGLQPKHSVRGKVSWTWMVGSNTTAGRWPITVSCGKEGAARTSFLVL